MRTAVPTKSVIKELRALERFLNGEKIMPATRYVGGFVVLSLMSKALRVASATCLLVKQGFDAEAFGMSRTLIEIFLISRYLTNKDTEKRAERYIEYHARIRTEWKRIIDTHYPVRAKEVGTLDPEIVATAKKYKTKAQWLGEWGQAKALASEPDTIELDETGQAVSAQFDYEALYFWAGHYVHATIESLRGHEFDAQEPFRVHSRKSLEKDLGGNALFNVLIFTCKIFICGLRFMKLEQPRPMQNIWKLIKRF